eukprot:TRINITY_DN4080_c0_g1_i2.p1 TRINITY_DN4080_c0_g1~~TRINITY_DN4080_c0_g1_i2.p1  ORF type:complete len:1007 (-),score=311.76 TRINITY_DN4080_c0_g1_i2:15-2990(-)
MENAKKITERNPDDAIKNTYNGDRFHDIDNTSQYSDAYSDDDFNDALEGSDSEFSLKSSAHLKKGAVARVSSGSGRMGKRPRMSGAGLIAELESTQAAGKRPKKPSKSEYQVEKYGRSRDPPIPLVIPKLAIASAAANGSYAASNGNTTPTGLVKGQRSSVVITAQEAAEKNRKLPKGYAYVPEQSGSAEVPTVYFKQTVSTPSAKAVDTPIAAKKDRRSVSSTATPKANTPKTQNIEYDVSDEAESPRRNKPGRKPKETPVGRKRKLDEYTEETPPVSSNLMNAANLKNCSKMLDGLMSNPLAPPFNQPVDPIKLNIPDYPVIIKRPMDLKTIKKNLKFGRFANVEEFVEDIRLVFRNAQTYNHHTTDVHKMSLSLSKVFESQIHTLFKAPEIVVVASGERSNDHKSELSQLRDQISKLSDVVQSLETKMNKMRADEQANTKTFNATIQQLKQSIQSIQTTQSTQNRDTTVSKPAGSTGPNLRRSSRTSAAIRQIESEDSDSYESVENLPVSFSKRQTPASVKAGKSKSDANGAKDAKMENAGSDYESSEGKSKKKTVYKPMTREEKQELIKNINDLPEEHLEKLSAIISRKMPSLSQNSSETIELEVDSLDTATLRQLEKCALQCLNPKKTKKKRPAPKKYIVDPILQAQNSGLGAEMKIQDVKMQLEALARKKAGGTNNQDDLTNDAQHGSRASGSESSGSSGSSSGSDSDTETSSEEEMPDSKDLIHSALSTNQNPPIVHPTPISASQPQSSTFPALPPSIFSSSKSDPALLFQFTPAETLRSSPSEINKGVQSIITAFGEAPVLSSTSSIKKDFILKNIDSWSRLKDDNDDSVKKTQSDESTSILWSDFKNKGVLNKQREREQLEREEKMRREMQEKEERRKKEIGEEEMRQKVAREQAEIESQRKRDEMRSAAKLERERKANNRSINMSEQSQLMASFETSLQNSGSMNVDPALIADRLQHSSSLANKTTGTDPASLSQDMPRKP